MRDGVDAAAPLLAKFEGSDISTSIIVSTSGAIRLYLHSEQQFNGKGFKCSYVEGEYTAFSSVKDHHHNHHLILNLNVFQLYVGLLFQTLLHAIYLAVSQAFYKSFTCLNLKM